MLFVLFDDVTGELFGALRELLFQVFLLSKIGDAERAAKHNGKVGKPDGDKKLPENTFKHG